MSTDLSTEVSARQIRAMKTPYSANTSLFRILSTLPAPKVTPAPKASRPVTRPSRPVTRPSYPSRPRYGNTPRYRSWYGASANTYPSSGYPSSGYLGFATGNHR